MLSLFQPVHEEELFIIVLESEFNDEFDLKDHLLLAVPSKIKVDELRRRIQGATDISCDRVLLLYCGQVLQGPNTYVPAEAFELTGIVDEDTGTFRPRICMQVTPDPVVRVKEEEPDAERKTGGGEDNGPKQTKVKHKRKAKSKGQFDLVKELTLVQCEKFADTIAKEGYDNEGAFANLSIETLRGPGLWIPLAAARKIHTLCVKAKKQLSDKDKETKRNHYRNIDVTGAITGTAPPGADAAEGGEQAHQDDHRAASEASTAVTVVAKNKADARREYEAEVIRQKKAAKEEAALIKAGKVRQPTDALKQHSEELTARIAAIRQRCKREDEENSADFDEVTGILYASYQRLREVNQNKRSGISNGAAVTESTSIALQPRASTADRATNMTNIAEPAGPGGSSPSRVLRALRTSASSASFSGAAVSSDHHPDFLCPGGFCCAKHAQAVLSNREVYYAQRKVHRHLELLVLLERIPSAEHGYVTSHSLRAIAARYLREYRGMPPRSADPALVTQAVEHARLGLAEQRSKVLCAQPNEVLRENLASVLPVVWYCPRRFAEGFVVLLEQLDRERLEDGQAES